MKKSTDKGFLCNTCTPDWPGHHFCSRRRARAQLEMASTLKALFLGLLLKSPELTAA